jgi:hypothetical protein
MMGVRMPKTLRRTISVLIAVAVTSLGVYGAVRVGGAVFPSGPAIASASTQVQVCPVSGCAATSCHGATGAPPPTNQSGGTAQSNAAPAPGGGSGSAVTYVCPRTGCTATSCHGATGAPPPSRSGHRRRASSSSGG